MVLLQLSRSVKAQIDGMTSQLGARFLSPFYSLSFFSFFIFFLFPSFITHFLLPPNSFHSHVIFAVQMQKKQMYQKQKAAYEQEKKRQGVDKKWRKFNKAIQIKSNLLDVKT